MYKLYLSWYANRTRKSIDEISRVDYCYPILGRVHELEYFNDILNEIGVAYRKYSGLLIEVWFKENKKSKNKISVRKTKLPHNLVHYNCNN